MFPCLAVATVLAQASVATPVVDTTIDMPDVSVRVGNVDAFDYYAARAGRVASFAGAYIRLGSDRYVWARAYDGTSYWGTDPGLRAANSFGTGTRVDLAAGNRTPTQLAAAMATAIDALDGWSASSTAGALAVSGPASASIGLSWDASTRGGLEGSHHARVDAAGYVDAPTDGVFAIRWVADYSGPIEALRILVGDTAGTSPRFWVRADDAGVLGVLLVDFGRVPTPVVDQFIEAPPPSSTPVEIVAGTAYWIIYSHDQGGGGASPTDIAFYPDTDAAHNGFTGDLLEVTAGESADPDVAPGSAAPMVTTIVSSSTFYPCFSLTIGGTEGDGSHFSLTDPEEVGTVGTPATSIDVDDVLLSAFIEMPHECRCAGVNVRVGATHTEQGRLGLAEGGTISPRASRTVVGATTVLDLGQTTGSATNAWIGGTSADVAIDTSRPTWALFTHPAGAGDEFPVVYSIGGALGAADDYYHWESDASGNAQVESVVLTGSHNDADVAYPATVTGSTLSPVLANFPALQILVFARGMVVQ